MLATIHTVLRGDTDESWRRSERVRNAALYLLVVLLCLLGSGVPKRGDSLVDSWQRSLFDRQMQWLRDFFPRPAAIEPVLIGIDESTVALFPEPITLWHRHLAQTLEALSHARPAAVGMDIVLPERSFENILPGIQIALIRSLVAISQRTKATFVFTDDADGKPVPVHPSYMRMLGRENFGSDQVQRDPDTVARRFAERILGGGTAEPSFAGQIARGLGRPVGEGYIDYGRGGAIQYVPIQHVIGWLQDGNDAELKRRFDGKVVLIGSLLKDRDQWKLPVSLAAWEPTLVQPGVVIHFQTLRSLLGAGLIAPLPPWVDWLAIFLFATAVWVRSSVRIFLAGALLAPLTLMVLSLLSLRANLLLPAAICIGTLMTALVVRATADGLRTAAEKTRWKRSFSGSVSPAVLRELMAEGSVNAGLSHAMNVCVLFSDIRGFTALSESLPPETVTMVLTRYFDRMVAVVHRYDGTIDKFIGDGMMVLFGAPRPLAFACANAAKCARDMLFALHELNQEFKTNGLPTFGVGIGINYGNAVVGNIGSSERHNYSAIGDVVNVASRLQGLTKHLGCQVVMTESVRLELGNFASDLDLVDCGEQAIRGHSPVRVWGIKVGADGI